MSQSTNAADREDFMIDTAQDLGDLCGAQPEADTYVAAIHMCEGYLLGVHHFHTALAAAIEEDIYCLNEAATVPTRNQVAADFSAWIASRPDVAEKEALEGLFAWAAEAYPCAAGAQTGEVNQ